jgi:excisionase family DNA binding protein
MAGRSAPRQASFPWTAAEASSAGQGRAPENPRRPPRTRPRATPALREGPSRWLTADEATAHLGFPSRKALYAAVERGQVPAHRLGLRRLRFKLDELDSLLGRLHESAGVR